jgi:tRNA A58 N-methylase Trm61
VLAEIVGPNGQVIAVECDDDLAAKARDNLRPRLRSTSSVATGGRTILARSMPSSFSLAQPTPLRSGSIA